MFLLQCRFDINSAINVFLVSQCHILFLIYRNSEALIALYCQNAKFLSTEISISRSMAVTSTKIFKSEVKVLLKFRVLKNQACAIN